MERKELLQGAVLSRRKVLQLAGLAAVSQFVGNENDAYVSEPIFPPKADPTPTNRSRIFRDETAPTEDTSFGNGLLIFEKSPLLRGVMDIKIPDPETGKDEIINNVVLETVVNGNINNAEMFGLDPHMRLLSHTNGIQTIEMQYGAFEGVTQVGRVKQVGNGSHVRVLVTIPDGKREITFRAIAEDDSTHIDAISFGNFYGESHVLRYYEVNGKVTDVLDAYPPPRDGNLIPGDFYPIIPPPLDGKISYWGDKSDLKQTLIVNVAEGELLDGVFNAELEVRNTVWRSEHNDVNPPHHWFELFRIFRRCTPDNTWTLRYGSL